MSFFSLFLGAPWWVWPLFCYLMFVGYSATKQRKMMIPFFFLLPIAFMWMKIELLMRAENIIKVLFCITLNIGIIVGFLVALREKISFERKSYEVLIPGNWYTLFLLILIFLVKFAFGAAQALESQHFFIIYVAETVVHALIVGFFFGKACCYTSRFFLNKE